MLDDIVRKIKAHRPYLLVKEEYRDSCYYNIMVKARSLDKRIISVKYPVLFATQEGKDLKNGSIITIDKGYEVISRKGFDAITKVVINEFTLIKEGNEEYKSRFNLKKDIEDRTNEINEEFTKKDFENELDEVLKERDNVLEKISENI